VDVLIPLHSSSLQQLHHYNNRFKQNGAQSTGEHYESENVDFFFVVNCYTPGVVWNEIVPMVRRNQHASQRLLVLMFQNTLSSICNNKSRRKDTPSDEANDHEATVDTDSIRTISPQHNDDVASDPSILTSFANEQIRIPSNLITRFVDCARNQNKYKCHTHRISSLLRNQRRKSRNLPPLVLPLYIIPPTTSRVDKSFEGIVISHERSMIQKQTMTAFMATLGGGYYMMKQLQPALNLARTQRAIAIELGNHHMAQQCLLNEAYNLLYAGRFRHAKVVLSTLENEVQAVIDSPLSSWADTDDAHQTLRQCHAARIWIRRISKLSSKLSKHHVGGSSVSSSSSTSAASADSIKQVGYHTKDLSVVKHCNGTRNSSDISNDENCLHREHYLIGDSDVGVNRKDRTALGDPKSRTVDDYYRVRIVAT
jgi:hypothetical protein